MTGEVSMTADEFPKTWRGRIVELAKVVGAVSILLSTAFGVWAATFGPVRDFFDRIARMEVDIAALKEDMLRATGEDRVIRQPRGLSYIEEPVREGENVVMYMVAERTRLGADCRLQNWTPIFTDTMNIPTPGQRAMAGPVRRQIGDSLVKLRVVMVPPDTLQPGRVEVYLALEYDCGGKHVPERSDVLAYRLLKAGEG